MFLFILIILLFVFTVASVNGTIAATPCEHALSGDVDLTLDGRCIGDMYSLDNHGMIR